MTEILLTVGWILSFVVLMALHLTAIRRGGWGADGAVSEAALRRMRPPLWGAAIFGLLCLLGLVVVTNH